MNFKGTTPLALLKRISGRTIKTEAGCWLCFPKHGSYARLTVNGKERSVHRLSWEIFYGPIPAGRWILHKCIAAGNCWNPEHLYLGTAKQNVADRVQQGRSARLSGELNPSAKLTLDSVRALRAERGLSCRQLGIKYGISYQQACDVRNRKNWSHV